MTAEIQTRVFDRLNRLLLHKLYKSLTDDVIDIQLRNRKGMIGEFISVEYVGCYMGIKKSNRFNVPNLNLPYKDYYKTFNVIEGDSLQLIQYQSVKQGIEPADSYRHDELDYTVIQTEGKDEINSLFVTLKEIHKVSNETLINDLHCDSLALVYKVNDIRNKDVSLNSNRNIVDKVLSVSIGYHNKVLYDSLSKHEYIANLSNNGYLVLIFKL